MKIAGRQAGHNFDAYGPVNAKPAELSRPQVTLSGIDILRVTCGLLGTAYSESFLVAYLTPYAGELGLSFSTALWTVIPLTSILTQPMVGAMSDRCRGRFGRRRPFLFLGTIVLGLGQFLIAICEDIAYAISPETKASIFFLVFLGIFSVGLSIQQVSLRALWADVVPPEQLPIIFACGTFFQLGGYILGYATTEVKWADTPYFNWIKTARCDGSSNTLCFDVRVTSITLVCVSWLANWLVLLSTREPNIAAPVMRGCCMPIMATVYGFKDALQSPMVRRVWECSILSWISWWCYYIFLSHFIAMELFGGDPATPSISMERRRYDEGVHFASGALFFTTIVGWCVAVFVSNITRTCGAGPSWLSANLITAALLLLSVKIAESPQRLTTAAWAAAFGIPFAFQITVPYLLILGDLQTGNAGILVAVPSMSAAIGQLLVAVCGAYVRDFCGTDLGCFAVGALLLCWCALRCLRICSLEWECSGTGEKKMKQAKK